MTAVVLLSLTGRLNAMPGEPGTAMTADVELGYDIERGFRHPGGLHTQADFDRVKKQLANGNRKVPWCHDGVSECPAMEDRGQ